MPSSSTSSLSQDWNSRQNHQAAMKGGVSLSNCSSHPQMNTSLPHNLQQRHRKLKRWHGGWAFQQPLPQLCQHLESSRPVPPKRVTLIILLWHCLFFNPVSAQGHSGQLYPPDHPATQPAGMLGNTGDYPEHLCAEMYLKNKECHGKTVSAGWRAFFLDTATFILETAC